jgi:hypothetical protein
LNSRELRARVGSMAAKRQVHGVGRVAGPDELPEPPRLEAAAGGAGQRLAVVEGAVGDARHGVFAHLLEGQRVERVEHAVVAAHGRLVWALGDAPRAQRQVVFALGRARDGVALLAARAADGDRGRPGGAADVAGQLGAGGLGGDAERDRGPAIGIACVGRRRLAARLRATLDWGRAVSVVAGAVARAVVDSRVLRRRHAVIAAAGGDAEEQQQRGGQEGERGRVDACFDHHGLTIAGAARPLKREGAAVAKGSRRRAGGLAPRAQWGQT